MNIWQHIKKLRPKQFLRLVGIFLKHPSYIIPSNLATKRTLAICNKHFGKEHHKHNKANAFRHALWNFLLCQKIFRLEKDLEKTMEWTKQITDLHEEIFFSTELDKAMDLHNNLVGRRLFEEKHEQLISENEIVEVLKQMSWEARQISVPEEEKKYFGRLVFIDF